MGYALVVYLFILVLLYSTLYILVIFFFVFHTQNNRWYVQFVPHGKGSSQLLKSDLLHGYLETTQQSMLG